MWLDDDELALVGERGATDRDEPGVEPEARGRGRVPVREGAPTRGSPSDSGPTARASNNSLDLFQDVKHLALMQKHAER